jgi:hypothetical protein
LKCKGTQHRQKYRKIGKGACEAAGPEGKKAQVRHELVTRSGYKAPRQGENETRVDRRTNTQEI